MFVSLALVVSACSSRTTESTATPISADAFAGTWRSVTPSLDFVRLEIASKSSQQGVMAARLSLSGVQMDVTGRISGDSLPFSMSRTGLTEPIGVLVVRLRQGDTLSAQMQGARELRFVREQ